MWKILHEVIGILKSAKKAISYSYPDTLASNKRVLVASLLGYCRENLTAAWRKIAFACLIMAQIHFRVMGGAKADKFLLGCEYSYVLMQS